MEIFDLYDREFNLLPHKIERSSKTKDGEYHLVVHIWIKNSDGKYLMQKRNKATDRIPFQWAATGGAVTTGEDSLHTAQREVEEEMGILIPIEKFQFKTHFFIETEDGNYITALYLVEEDVDIDSLTLQLSEVKRCDYFSLEEIKQMIKDKQCWRYEDHDSTKDYFSHII